MSNCRLPWDAPHRTSADSRLRQWFLLVFLLLECHSVTTSWASALLVQVNSPRLHPRRALRAVWSSRGGASTGGNEPATSIQIVKDHGELPHDFPRRHDVLVALSAVRQACAITRALQPRIGSGGTSPSTQDTAIGTVEKADTSPVTVADFAVQAVVLHHLHNAFPDDGFIAEEDTSALVNNSELCQTVVAATRCLTRNQTLAGIDLGKSYRKWANGGSATGATATGRPRRVWTLDPIDGTKGFLRGRRSGGQYAIALSLLEDGDPTIGILGCPNLPTNVHDDKFEWAEDESEDDNGRAYKKEQQSIQRRRGCIFVASQGGGCYQLPLIPSLSLETKAIQRLSATPNDGSTRRVHQGRFCIGVEKFSDARGECAAMARILYRTNDDTPFATMSRRIDSQAKHGVLARGGAEWYVRLPRPGYVEWIWDHAAGKVVIEEAGGTMTDTNGHALDFGLGAQLSPSVNGILMSCGGVFHAALVDAYKKQSEERLREEWRDK